MRLRRSLLLLAATSVVGLCAAAWSVQPASARVSSLVATSTALSLSPSSPTAGQQVTLTATVSTISNGSPAGTVSFADGTTVLDSASLSSSGSNSSTATLTTTLGSGHHDLTATYITRFDPVSRNIFTTSKSSTVSVDIASATPTTHATTVTVSANPTTLQTSQPSVLTAAVTDAVDNSSVQSGSVEFYDNGTDLGGASVSNGVATLNASGFIAGNNAITANFTPASDDTVHQWSTTTSSLSITATAPPTIHRTTISLTTSPSSVQTGQSATFTASVIAADGDTAVATGNVQFWDNGVPIAGSVTLDSSGVARLVWTGFGAGTHKITAKYQGDSTHQASTSGESSVSATSPPVAVATSITASISPNPIVAGGKATLSAHVQQVGSSVTPPQGSVVTFRNAADGSLIGQAFLDSSGNGSVTTTGWNPGHYDITATYVGDANDASSSAGFSADVRNSSPLTVTAPSPTITYGTSIQSVNLTPTYSGFVAGEGPSAFTTQPTCTLGTSANVLPPGTYPVTCSGAVDPLYTFTYVAGTLTVQQASLTVTPDSQTITAGDPIPNLTATISGFVNGESLGSSDVTGSPSCSTTATSSSPAGTYPITCTLGTLASSDYSLNLSGQQGTLTIKSKASIPTFAIAWVGGPFVAGQPVTLYGSLFASFLHPLSNEQLTLSLGNASCTATTDFFGFATCSVTPTGPLGPTQSTATFAGDDPYAASSGSQPALLYAFPSGGGAFVIGDRNADTGDSVTFWSSQWWRSNSLSDGGSSRTFKGWAGQPTTPDFGDQWSAGSSPPAGPLPSYMGVIVTDEINSSHGSISGEVTGIVVVTPDSGYAPDSNHTGTGTVVAELNPPASWGVRGSLNTSGSSGSGSQNPYQIQYQ